VTTSTYTQGLQAMYQPGWQPGQHLQGLGAQYQSQPFPMQQYPQQYPVQQYPQSGFAGQQAAGQPFGQFGQLGHFGQSAPQFPGPLAELQQVSGELFRLTQIVQHIVRQIQAPYAIQQQLPIWA